MLCQGQGAAMVRPHGGEAITMVYATGMRTDFGRTGALPQRVGVDPLIAVIVIGSGPARRQPRARSGRDLLLWGCLEPGSGLERREAQPPAGYVDRIPRDAPNNGEWFS